MYVYLSMYLCPHLLVLLKLQVELGELVPHPHLYVCTHTHTYIYIIYKYVCISIYLSVHTCSCFLSCR